MSTEKSSTTSKKITYPTYEMESKGRLILPVEIINQIMYLHSSIGKTEWSGLLLYDVISGNPSKPSDFVLKAKHIFLMDVGSAAYTEYETDGDIVDLYDNIEGAMEMKMGHVHSHHDMSAFFSGTDTDELMQNADKHNYYLSLIVNFSGNYVAKVAFLSERKLV
jgi:proteasome lid subunit RPN8/RPN11